MALFLAYALAHNFLYIETSAYSQQNVHLAFELLISEVYHMIKKSELESIQTQSELYSTPFLSVEGGRRKERRKSFDAVFYDQAKSLVNSFFADDENEDDDDEESEERPVKHSSVPLINIERAPSIHRDEDDRGRKKVLLDVDPTDASRSKSVGGGERRSRGGQ